MPTGIRLLRECEERIECASDVLGASVDNVADRGADGEGTGTDVSPNAVTSGAWGVGMNTVFRTSLRPLFAVGLRDVTPCCYGLLG